MARNSTKVREMIETELSRARTKYPIWPTDIIHRAMIIMGQAGGVANEAYRCLYANQQGNHEYLERRVLALIVVCIRWMEGD